MATIKFLLQSKSDNAQVYVRFRDGRAFDIKARTKFCIDAELWDDKTGYPKTNLKDETKKKKCSGIQSNLIDFKNRLDATYNNEPIKSGIDKEWLGSFISPPIEVVKVSNNLIEFIDYYNDNCKDNVRGGTLKRNKATRNLIYKFQTNNKSVFLVKDVSPDFTKEFEKYCKSENYSVNYISRAVRYLKTICFYAKSNDVEVSPKVELIKPLKPIKVDKIYITPDELKLIEEKQFDSDYLDNARDWLLISCETGQRVSDFMRFDKSMIRIKKNKKGEVKTMISFTQVKTDKLMDIPLSKKVLQILKKRKGEFPRSISDQKYNEYLKEVCQQSELKELVKGSKSNVDSKGPRKESGVFEKWELITSHVGRRSFATNNYGTIPTSILIYMTGHSTEKMFLEYIGKSDEDKSMNAAEYF